MNEEEYKENLADKILDIADQLKGYNYKSILKKELKDIEEPEELDIMRAFKAVLRHFEDQRKNSSKKVSTSGSQLSDEDRWLTRQQAAERIEVDLSTIKRLIKDKKLKEYGTGRIKRYKASDVDAAFQMLLGSAIPVLCIEDLRHFNLKLLKLLTFDKGKKYKIIYENSIWVHVYNKEWMDSLRISQKEFRKYFSRKGEIGYEVANFNL